MKKIPFLYTMIRGAVGKQFVVKHYGGGKIVVTKFPDMSGIVPSGKQRVKRDLFREAVVYGKWIVADEERKKAFGKTLPWKKRKHVYQAAIQMYMRMQGDRQWLRKQLAVKEVVRSEKGETLDVKCQRSNVKGGLSKVKVGSVGGEMTNCNGGFEQMGHWLKWPWEVVWKKIELGHGEPESIGPKGVGVKCIE